MKNVLFALAVVSLFTLCAGCKPTGAGNKPSVAVMDLDAAAVSLEWSSEFEGKMRTQEEGLNEQLRRMQATFQEQLRLRVEAAGEEPTTEEQQEIQQFNQRATTVLQNALNEARQKTAQQRSDLIADFRKTVKPYAEEVATEMGASVVLLKADPVFYFQPTVDITEKVVEKMKLANWRKAMPAATDDETEAAATTAEPQPTETAPAAETEK